MFNSNPLYFIISTPDYSEERKKEEDINKTQKSFLFAPIDALMLGNSFKNEYRGYKNYKPGVSTPKTEKEKIMLELMAYDIVAHDLGLYLDIYPNDKEAALEFEKYSKLASDKKKEYIDKYGPLTQAEGKYKDGYMDYVTKPSAWLGD